MARRCLGRLAPRRNLKAAIEIFRERAAARSAVRMSAEQPPIVRPMTETLPDLAAIDAEFTPEHLNTMSPEERVSKSVTAFSRRRHDAGAAHVTWWLWRTPDVAFDNGHEQHQTYG